MAYREKGTADLKRPNSFQSVPLPVMKAFLFILFVGLSASAKVQKGKAPPKYPDVYTVQGVLFLPYAEIKEPFTAYYDGTNNRSRIDYYGDMVKTLQLAFPQNATKYGVSYKVAFMPDDKTREPRPTCFQVNGTANNTIAMQSVLPNLADFKFITTEKCESEDCDRFEYMITNQNKTNKYTFWSKSDKTGKPIRYIMKGYNSLLGSHYDKYEVQYGTFIPGKVNSTVFNVSSLVKTKCRSFPGPGVQHVTHLNPIKEFIDNHEDHMHDAFEEFKNTHQKTYAHQKEHEERREIFRQNFRYINSVNRANLGYTLKVNQLADLADHERYYLRGRLPHSGPVCGQKFPKDKFDPNLAPSHLDWRLYGAVTPVKDQAVCGSCWSFGTVGHIEGQYFRKAGKLVRLSEQQLIDCSWNYQNNGCDGGEDFRAYKYIQEHGLSTDEEYGPYLGQDGICRENNVSKTVLSVSDCTNVTSQEELQLALAYIGPISVSIDASLKAFSFYSNGVFYDKNCKNKPDDLDHSVLAVGYGVLDGKPYWLIKNSWSTYWGNDGYVLISQRDNTCGVSTAATYVDIKI